VCTNEQWQLFLLDIGTLSLYSCLKIDFSSPLNMYQFLFVNIFKEDLTPQVDSAGVVSRMICVI